MMFQTAILPSIAGGLAALVMLGSSLPTHAQAAETVAGRSVEDYRAQLEDQDRVVRVRAARSLGAFGPVAAAALREGLDHPDPAVRYVVAVALGNLAGEPLELAEPKLDALAEADDSAAVRLAASYALCRAGHLEPHLPRLLAALESPARAVACSAAELIGQIGPDAAAAIGRLEEVLRGNRPGGSGDYHLGGAAQNALRKIRGEATGTQP